MAMHLWAVAEAAATKRHVTAASDAAGYAAGVAAWMLAASVFIAFKLAAGELPPWTMCFFRALLSALVLMPLVTHHRREMLALLRQRWRELAFIGAIGLGLTQGVIFTALNYTTAVNVGIVLALVPMIMMAQARFLLGERMNSWQALGSFVAFAGIVVISVQGSLARLLGLDVGIGELIALAAAVMFASYGVLLRRARFALAPIPLLVMLLLAGSAAALPFYLTELARGEHADLALNGYLVLVYAATLGGAGLYLLYNWSITVLGASRAGTLVYTQSVFVAFFAWLVLGEALEWYHFAGGGLVVVGVLLVTLLRPKPVAHPA